MKNTVLLFKNVKGRDHLVDVGVDVRIILKLIWRKEVEYGLYLSASG
jgi:hypothetical protein